MSKEQFVLGMDIGYSNLKLVYGRGDKFETKVMPVGAGPEKHLPIQLTGAESATANGVFVDVEGERWIAGVEPDSLQGWDRELHPDYPSSRQYLALFKAALAYTSVKEIDVLVTGLPVQHFKDEAKKQALIERLQGEHIISAKKKVTVHKVVVLAQPSGAYMSMLHDCAGDKEMLDIVLEGRTIVLDFGFFSFDWVCLEQGAVRYSSSGSSLKAMSRVLEKTAELISRDYGYCMPLAKIERSIRQGKNYIVVTGEKVDLDGYFKEASDLVAQEALVPLQTSMRDDDVYADILLLAGGGSVSYERASKAIFPKANLLTFDDSVAANARGFYLTGVRS